MPKPARVPIGKRVAPARFLLFAAALVTATCAAAATGIEARFAPLIGFDAAAFLFILTAVPLLNADAQFMRRAAERNDANRAGLLAISVLLSLVILIALGALVADSSTPRSTGEAAIIVVTLLLSWLFANVVFTLHYAHLFYLQRDGGDRRGLEIPGTTEPDYWDFLYFSFTLGMTFQTSDVSIPGRYMRKVALGQCMAAFVFNMGILAFTVNALGG